MRIFVLATLLIASTASAKRPAPGDPAPPFSAEATNGKTVKLADFAKQTVVLAFYPKAFTGG
jgi:peroxiredoxin Q/BCP